MSETKWAPGAWNLMRTETGYTIGPNQQLRGDYVADVHEHQSGAMSDEEAAANAHLIAAAPELYEALESLMDALDTHCGSTPVWSVYMERARTTLDRARGEK